MAETCEFEDGFRCGSRDYVFASLTRAFPDAALERVPVCLKLLFENVVRRAPHAVPMLRGWLAGKEERPELAFHPGRILMHDTTCLPALADFAAMRDAVAERGGDPSTINPAIPIDVVMDHSVAVDHWGHANAAHLNLQLDLRRNAERYRLVKWAQRASSGFRVVPPENGIIHQINLEVLTTVVSTLPRASGPPLAFPDSVLGTDTPVRSGSPYLAHEEQPKEGRRGED